jgi:hypothetical protein
MGEPPQFWVAAASLVQQLKHEAPHLGLNTDLFRGHPLGGQQDLRRFGGSTPLAIAAGDINQALGAALKGWQAGWADVLGVFDRGSTVA